MDALQQYRKKRDFRITPEPAGGRASRGRPHKGLRGRYVIHKHAARALHYDLRLELDGVFKSWAVPKGLGLSPGAKHLAVQVEDHPLEYGTFEGVIPKGEYGGGTVMIWDRGRWSSTNTRRDLASGKLDIVLAGEKLRGAWTLVRMGGRKNADGKNWLLIKRHDETAPARSSAPSDLSVESGRSMREIARARARTWTRAGEARSDTAPARHVPMPSRLDGAVRAQPPAEVLPQLATLVDEPPRGPEWIHEIKLDGYRIVACVQSAQRRCEVRLSSRNGKDWTTRFPEVAEQLRDLPVRAALLDGEVVALSADGRTSFRNLQQALSSERTPALVYYAFDLLYLDGYDLRGVPLLARKGALAAVLGAAGFLGDGRVRYTDHVHGRGERVFREACRIGLEGIVSKKRDAPYRAGRSRGWLKTKCNQHEEFVVGGYTEPGGARVGFGALLLGAYDDAGRLEYAGRVGTGFDTRALTDLASRLTALETTRCPFAGRVPEKRGVHWVKPELVAEVEFTERTREGLLRHPTFRGLREDKDPGEAVVKRRAKVAAQATVAGVTLSNPDRVLWPEQGTTKLELARYYESIERWLLPELRERPLALLRCPEGRTRACFFQKHPGETMSPEIPRVAIEEKTTVDSYMYVSKISDVIRLVQMGVLELHVWGSRVTDLEHPDIMVFDLDPGPGVDWNDVVAAAKQLRGVLEGLNLGAFPRLTGGKGLHVVVPLTPSADWDTVKAFSLAVARQMTHDESSRFTTNMSKAKRPGKIFIDYLRNGRGATAIASYSTRAREGAPVAIPVRWSELTPAMKPDRYNVATVAKRLNSLRTDPWQGFEAARRPLEKPNDTKRKGKRPQ